MSEINIETKTVSAGIGSENAVPAFHIVVGILWMNTLQASFSSKNRQLLISVNMSVLFIRNQCVTGTKCPMV
ncbi:hypothetical protein, partial [Prevotella sp. OH937_COT-195]|uniref:hypothetical protein n=1 Tax=Prevotella sp. OH937_COT-195 TaxID=2491051 RepID=UPI001F17363E